MLRRGRFVRTDVAHTAGVSRNAAIGVVVLMIGAATLLLFPPARHGFYPRCPFFEATGLLCPGCGGTRALAALLRGDVMGAWRLNGLVVALLPFAAGWGVLRPWRVEVRVPREVWVGFGIVVGMFGVLRNL
jgi:hypothetical protein